MDAALVVVVVVVVTGLSHVCAQQNLGDGQNT